MSAALPPVLATVGGLVRRQDGSALFVRTHKWGGRWGLPGGKIDRGETMEAAFRREILEETGLHLGQVRFVMAQEAIDDPEFHKPSHMILLNYVADLAGGELHLNDEAQEARWLGLQEAAQDLHLNRVTRALVEAVLAQEEAQSGPDSGPQGP